jgi:hypothetical protein
MILGAIEYLQRIFVFYPDKVRIRTVWLWRTVAVPPRIRIDITGHDEVILTDAVTGRRCLRIPRDYTLSGKLARDLEPATRVEMSTDSGAIPRPSRGPRASACEPYRELITEALRRGRNAMAIWQDLVDDHGFTARYASVRRPVDAEVVVNDLVAQTRDLFPGNLRVL